MGNKVFVRCALAGVALLAVTGCQAPERDPDRARSGEIAFVNVAGSWIGAPDALAPGVYLKLEVSPTGAFLMQARRRSGVSDVVVDGSVGHLRADGYHVEGDAPARRGSVLAPLSAWKADVIGGERRRLWLVDAAGRTFSLRWSGV